MGPQEAYACASSTAGPLTSAFFNPALAASVTFHCSGHSLLEYTQVYWLGPLTGKEQGTHRASWSTGLRGPARWWGVHPGPVSWLWGPVGRGGCCCGAWAPLTGLDLETPPQFQLEALPSPYWGRGSEWRFLVWTSSQRGLEPGTKVAGERQTLRGSGATRRGSLCSLQGSSETRSQEQGHVMGSPRGTVGGVRQLEGPCPRQGCGRRLGCPLCFLGEAPL